MAAPRDRTLSGLAACVQPSENALAAEDGAAEIAILLSPACASFDQFPNFELRGAAFVDAVRALPNSGNTQEVA